MAIKRPDIYEHNNPNNAFVDSNFVRGGFRTSVADLSALYALSGKTDQLKAHSTVVYVTGTTKYYILKDISNVGNANGWEEFVTGTGAGVITGATNGLTVSSKDVKLGGNLCEGTTIYTCEYGLYYAASPALNSYIQTCLSNTYGLNTYQVLFDDTGSTKSNHFCMTSTSGELYFANDSNNCSSIYGDTSKLCLINKTAGASKIVILDGNALNYGNNYASSFVARSLPDVAWITACTSNALSNYYTKTQINNYTGTTVPNTYVTKLTFNLFTGTTLPANYYTKTQINYFTGTTLPANYYTKTQINYFTGTTLPANYYTKTQINSYTGNTNNRITAIESKYITGATNGLTKVGKQVKLGGALTGTTIITTGTNSFKVTDNGTNTCFALQTNSIMSEINIDGVSNYVNIDNTQVDIHSQNIAGCYSKTALKDGCYLIDYSCCAKIIDASATPRGLLYDNNYSSGFTARSIPDVAYVTGLTTTIELGKAWCWNGSHITNCGRNINNENGGGDFSWYGPNRFIWGDAAYFASGFCVTSNNISIMNAHGGIVMDNGSGVLNYTSNLSSFFTARSLVDAAYVTGITSTSGVHFACNGITKVGQTVILGGELTGNTCIYSANVANCTYINFNRTNSSISTYTKGGDISLCSVSNGGIGGKICITSTSGMTYAADYSANYTNRTIVDKEYVDKKMSIISVRNTYGVCPFYINNIDNFIGVSGYTVGSCACLYLIPTPATGQKIIISDIQGQALDYPISIDGNGKCINGNDAAMINTDYGSITFVFNGYFWSAVAFVN